MQLEKIAREMVLNAIEEVKPDKAIKKALRLEDRQLFVSQTCIPLDDFEGIYVIGFGKASALMAQVTEEILKDWIIGGMVITKYGHALPTQKIRVVEASHPVLDENTIQYTKEMLQQIKSLSHKTLILTLISGGGSALLEALPEGINLSDMQITVEELLKSGADIKELNTVRKHLSIVKGGQLLKQIYPKKNISLIISDVIGDPIEFIASGPTAPDSTSYQDTYNVLQKYRVWDRIPANIRAHIEKGLNGEIPETPKENDPIFHFNENKIIANNVIALKKLEQQARESGFYPIVLSNRIEGEAREIGKAIAGMLYSVVEHKYPVSSPAAIIFGGETTVTVTGDGKGGRNQEMATGFMTKVIDYKGNYAFIACGTDGTDGPTDAAGGIITPEKVHTLLELKEDPFHYLENNNCYYLLKKIKALFFTGPTQTNVMDINLLLVE